MMRLAMVCRSFGGSCPALLTDKCVSGGESTWLLRGNPYCCLVDTDLWQDRQEMGRAATFVKKLRKIAGAYTSVTYCKKQGVFRVKNAQKAPRFVPFCSMYGDLLSYPFDTVGVATMVKFAHGGARGVIARHIVSSPPDPIDR